MKWKRAVQLIKFDEWRRNHIYIYISLTETDLLVLFNLLSIYLFSVFRSSPSFGAPRGLSCQADETTRQAAAVSHRARHTYLQEQTFPGAAG